METIREALEQYCEKKQEIKDLKCRIDKEERYLEKIKREGMVSDTVKGTRKDGTFGPIKITGYPIPEHKKMETMIKKRLEKLHIMEDELLEAMNRVDDFINAIPRSDLRTMFRMYYLDDMTWEFVAMKMNYAFPNKKTPYTKDNCRMRHNRYLEKVEKN